MLSAVSQQKNPIRFFFVLLRPFILCFPHNPILMALFGHTHQKNIQFIFELYKTNDNKKRCEQFGKRTEEKAHHIQNRINFGCAHSQNERLIEQKFNGICIVML